MYDTILERVLNYLSVGIKITHVHRIYNLIFYVLREDFMNLKALCLRFFTHIVKVSGMLFFFGTAIINHFIQHIYILFVMFKYVFHHYCDVAHLAD